jgi:hypothetical protein
MCFFLESNRVSLSTTGGSAGDSQGTQLTPSSKHQFQLLLTREAPDIRPDNPAFFNIRYPAGYQIVMPDIRYGRISVMAGYRISGSCLADTIIY